MGAVGSGECLHAQSRSRGLGRALAEAVLAAGDKLVATARKPAQLTDLVDRYGGQVRAVALDVTD